MDFDRIRSAAQEIKLSDSEKLKMLEVCENAKTEKKKNRHIPAIVAAAAAVVLVLFSPGFLFRASMKDAESMENMAADDYDYLADQFVEEDGMGSISLQSSSKAAYRSIYYEIPKEFRELVSEKEYNEWESGLIGAHGMPVFSFILNFDISREDFDRANTAYANRIQEDFGMVPLLRAADCAEQEQAEIFNADIIYTFNLTEIQEYYRVPEYAFSSMREFSYAVRNGYSSLSQQAEITVNEKRADSE